METLLELDVQGVKKEFPILNRLINNKSLVYLDNSSTTQKPYQVIQAMDNYYKQSNANVHRGVYKLSEEASAMYEEAHKKTADFINASGIEEIVFTKNTTESINLLAYSLSQKLEKGDEIVLTQMEHHSNLVPWQQIARQKGAVLKFLEIEKNGLLKPGWESKITNKTKIVSVIHVSNVLGNVSPVKEIGKIAKETQALFIVDGAQSIPHIPVDVKRIGCDFLAFSGHKMLGPTGIGILFGREDVLEEMSPFLYGGDMIREVAFDKASWNKLPWKFEAGTPNISGGIGLSAAIDYLENIGLENVSEHEKEITEYAIEKLSEMKNIEIFGPSLEDQPERAGIISFNVNGIHSHDLATILDREAVAIRGGHHCAMPLMGLLGVSSTARASFYIYNTKEDVDRLCEGIEKAKKIFGIE